MDRVMLWIMEGDRRTMSRIDIVGQNGNDGLHYEYELDKSTGEVVKKYVEIIKDDGFKKVKNMWNYRIIKKYDETMEEDLYFLTEVFYEKDGKPMAYADIDIVSGNSPSEVIAVLEMMLKDVKKDRPVLTEDDFKV